MRESGRRSTLQMTDLILYAEISEVLLYSKSHAWKSKRYCAPFTCNSDVYIKDTLTTCTEISSSVYYHDITDTLLDKNILNM